MPGLTLLQQQAVEQFSTLEAASVGQFKQIMPMEDPTKAVAVVRASHGIQAKNDLEHENKLLGILRDNGFPALNTYDGVFEIDAGKYGLVMDYLANCSLIDAKAPDMMKVLLPALMTGVAVDTGKEAWAMQVPAISKKVQEALKQKDPMQLKDFAMNLGSQVKQLVQTMQEKSLVVADLQMLVDQNGKITIIDPLDVLRVIPTPRGMEFKDVINPDKPNTPSFINTLYDSMAMLEDMVKTCDAIAKAKPEHLPMVVSSLMTSTRPRSASLPASPVMERRVPPGRPSSAPAALGGRPSVRAESSSMAASSSVRARPLIPAQDLAKEKVHELPNEVGKPTKTGRPEDMPKASKGKEPAENLVKEAPQKPKSR